ncbi:hypothetical protein [Virgibacillus kimchii]
MPQNEDVTEVKEFMNVLTEVKVSVAEMNGKMDRVMDSTDDTKRVVEGLQKEHAETKETANAAYNKAETNEKSIERIESNNKKTNLALLSIVGAFVLQLIYFILTFNF